MEVRNGHCRFALAHVKVPNKSLMGQDKLAKICQFNPLDMRGVGDELPEFRAGRAVRARLCGF